MNVFQTKNLEDYNRENPGALAAIKDWFRTVKTYDGKPENVFGHGGRILSAERAIEIVHDNHQFYKDLIAGKTKNDQGLWLGNDKTAAASITTTS